jgi:outer membrane lipoprotein-sorting protein
MIMKKMTMKKLTLALMFSVLSIPALAGMSRIQSRTADEVVEKYIAALGGRAALGKITSRRSTGTISVTTPNGEIAGTAEISVKAPNKSRQVMTLDLVPLGGPGPLVVQQIFNGTTAWSLDSMNGDTEITGNRLENLRNNLFPTPLLTYKTVGATLELLPAEKLNGKDVVVLRFTPKAGSATKLHFDAETYLLVRTVATVNIPQAGGDIEQTGDFSDYRAVDGVKVPFAVTNSSPLQAFTIKFVKIEHNVALDDAIFVKK